MLDKILAVLEREVCGWKAVIGFSLSASLVYLVWAICITNFYFLTGIWQNEFVTTTHTKDLFEVIGLIIFTPIWEEVVFRYMPLIIVIMLCGVSKKVLYCALIVSILFGFLHGGYAHIFVQGVVGILFSIVFLKCGGLQKKYIKAVSASTLTHFGVNSGTFVLSLI